MDESLSSEEDSSSEGSHEKSSSSQAMWRRRMKKSGGGNNIDGALKEQLGLVYVGLPNFCNTFFEGIAGLAPASSAFFEQCIQGSNPLDGSIPLFSEGWKEWPEDANQEAVMDWLADFSEKVATFAERYRPEREPREMVNGSIVISLTKNKSAGNKSRFHQSGLALVPGVLKSSPSYDEPSVAWLNLGRHARKVLHYQDDRHFVFGYTICGSLMRIWLFDRVGAIASEHFDINKEGRLFVSTILGFFWMDDGQHGFDSTIKLEWKKAAGTERIIGIDRFIEIERDGLTERIIIDETLHRVSCIAGRATTCWKAHREGFPEIPLVIKDSWHYPERDEEGCLLRDATTASGGNVTKVTNVARYYYHETVQDGGADHDIRKKVRKGLHVTKAKHYQPGRSAALRSSTEAGLPQSGPSGSTATGPPANTPAINDADNKRPFGQNDSPLPPAKRPCFSTPTTDNSMVANRVHRRIILRDFGKPIYQASSRAAFLGALDGCIEGHRTLYEAGILHRDISTNNLMINEGVDDPSLGSFLIDLDLSIKVEQIGSEQAGFAGTKGMIGTKPFTAIGALRGEQRSFMHDLESFFWVLFWVCVHYEGPNIVRFVESYDEWRRGNPRRLVKYKLGCIASQIGFNEITAEDFTPYFQPLRPCIDELRQVVFPNGFRWMAPRPELYSEMQEVIRRARKRELESEAKVCESKVDEARDSEGAKL